MEEALKLEEQLNNQFYNVESRPAADEYERLKEEYYGQDSVVP